MCNSVGAKCTEFWLGRSSTSIGVNFGSGKVGLRLKQSSTSVRAKYIALRLRRNSTLIEAKYVVIRVRQSTYIILRLGRSMCIRTYIRMHVRTYFG